jgi:hypothetical protein
VHAVLAPRPGDERARQQRDVALALAQGRVVDRKDVQAVIEVLAKVAALHALEQVAVVVADHAHVDLYCRVAADTLELLLLEYA